MKAKLLIYLAVFSMVSTSFAAEELWHSELGRERIFNALVDIFRDNYWDPDYRDWDTWAETYHDQAIAAESRSAFDSTLGRMVGDLGDDHSRFVGLVATLPLDAEEEAGTVGEPGMGFSHSYLARTGVVVERVYPQTPAATAGLRRGDVILRVNAQDLRDRSGSFGVDRLFREAIASGDVQLSIRRKSEHLSLAVHPGPVDFATAQDQPQGEMLDDGTGYIYIPSFRGEVVADEVHRLLNDLESQGAKGIVLDLRDNLGGRLGELGLVLGAFIEGPWVEATSRDEVIWRSRYLAQDDRGLNVLETLEGSSLAGDVLREPARFSGPLAVIVSNRNSSAGEVAALVLQELGRATIVGEPTHGNVEAIQGFDLPDGSRVYVAVANLRGTSGLDFSAGVVPDVLSSDTLQELARGYDAPVAEAVRALKALPFTPGKFF